MPGAPVNSKDKHIQLTKAQPSLTFQTVPVVPTCDSWEDEPGMRPSNIVELDVVGHIVPQGTVLCTMSQSAPAASQDVVSQSAPAASQSPEFIPGRQWRSNDESKNHLLLPGAMDAPGLDAPPLPSFQMHAWTGLLGQEYQAERPSLAQGPAISIHRELGVDEIADKHSRDMAAALQLAEEPAEEPNQGGSRQKLRENGQCDSFTFEERERYKGREWFSEDYQDGGDW